MSKVTAAAERLIDTPTEKVQVVVSDYENRPKILTDHYRDYVVVEGGFGAGTTAAWKLHATSKRVRDVRAAVTEPTPGTLVETDENSSMVTTWTVRESGDGTVVRIETTWDGATGVAGFFERTFAPRGLKAIYKGVLDNLATVSAAEASK
ncbi:MAG: SRPBCC family protein [Mycobacteriales bacterium]